MDIFVNVATERSNLEEMEHLLFNLRRTRRTKDTLESTHHAVCREFIKFGQIDRLIEIIEKPLEYGLFPDSFCFNMILDLLIQEGRWDAAARVAFTYILQEDFSNAITNRLASHGVVKYLFSPTPAPQEQKEETNVAEGEQAGGGDYDDDETQYLRIPVIRNPYFDDHFDLTDPKKKAGKSLFLLGRQSEGDLGFNMRALGLVLWSKYQDVEKLILSTEASSLTKDVYEKMTSVLQEDSNEEMKDQIDSLTSK